MPVTLDMHDENQILVLAITEPWTIAQLKSVYPTAISFLDRVPHKVNILIDLTAMKHVPLPGLWDRNSPLVVHANSGEIAVAGASSYTRSLAEASFRLINFERVHFFLNWSEAYRFLISQSPTQPTQP